MICYLPQRTAGVSYKYMEMHRIAYLYQRWKEKQLTEDEQREFRWLLGDERAEEALKAHWGAEWKNPDHAAERQALEERHEAIFRDIITRPQEGVSKHRFTGWRIAAIAASIALLVSIGIMRFMSREQTSPQSELVEATQIAPGGNRALLTLVDGRTIDLSAEQHGIVMADGISYLDGSTVWGDQPDHESGKDLFTLSTPKGGTYQITLPDGTKVWLNAASTLIYPAKFEGPAREVRLVGEAYFDVAKQSTPFLVVTEGQTTEVLGTQFNILAYPEEQEIQTTLVTGSVQVSAEGVAQPIRLDVGEQSVRSAALFKKAKVDIRSVVAWKDGLFSFRDTELQTAMNQLSRWYDLEVVYEGDIPPTHFFGDISRQQPLSGALELLVESGLRVRIERTAAGNRLIVMP